MPCAIMMQPMEHKHQLKCYTCGGKLVMRGELFLCETCPLDEIPARNQARDMANRIDTETLNEVIFMAGTSLGKTEIDSNV